MVPYLLLLLIVSFTSLYSVIFFMGPSIYGDDFYYSQLAYNITRGGFTEAGNIDPILSIRLLQIFPMAFFYELLGYGAGPAAAWDFLSFIGTVIAVFFIGKELYDYRAGLLSSALLSIMPIVVQYSTTVSDNITMMFLTTIVVLALVKATKMNSHAWYFALGAAIVASLLTTPQSEIFAFVVFAYLAVELLRRKIRISRTSLFLLYGIAASLLVLFAFNYLNNGNPLLTFTYTSTYYSGDVGVNFTLSTDQYLFSMFPYSIFSTLSTISTNPTAPSNLITNIWSSTAPCGAYFYAAFVVLAYLIVKRERRAYLPVFLFLGCFLYMNFGPTHIGLNPFAYVLAPRLDRYLILLAVPAVLMMAMAIVRAFRTRSNAWKAVSAVVVLSGLAFLVATSLHVNLFWYYVWDNSRYGQLQIASLLSALPNTTRVYYVQGFFFVPIYVHYNNDSRFIQYDPYSYCYNFSGGVYVAVPNNIPPPVPPSQVKAPYLPLNITDYCPYWQEVIAGSNTTVQIPLSQYDIYAISRIARPWSLYYVPKNTTG